jgi:hypothetical protein
VPAYPRDSLPWLDRTWRLKRIDDLPIRCISCLYVRKGYRRKRATSALIEAAGMGYASRFARAGFKIVVSQRPVRSCAAISEAVKQRTAITG